MSSPNEKNCNNLQKSQDISNSLSSPSNLERLKVVLPVSEKKNELETKEEIPIEELGQVQSSHFLSVLKGINCLRICSIISSIIFIGSIITSIILFYLNKQKQFNLLMNLLFELDYIPFQTQKYVFTAYLILLAIMTLSFSIALLRNHYSFQYPFKEDLAILFPFVKLFLSTALILGIVLEKSILTIAIDGGLYILSFLMLIVMYKKSKNRKNQTLTTLINESFLISMFTSFICYLLLYSLCNYISNDTSIDHKKNISIIFNGIYAGIALVLLTLYKDIIFPLCLLIIECGLLAYEKSYSHKDNLSVIIIIVFMVLSIILTIVKFKQKIFGYDKDAELIISNYKKNKSKSNL